MHAAVHHACKTGAACCVCARAWWHAAHSTCTSPMNTRKVLIPPPSPAPFVAARRRSKLWHDALKRQRVSLCKSTMKWIVSSLVEMCINHLCDCLAAFIWLTAPEIFVIRRHHNKKAITCSVLHCFALCSSHSHLPLRLSLRALGADDALNRPRKPLCKNTMKWMVSSLSGSMYIDCLLRKYLYSEDIITQNVLTWSIHR